MAEGRVGLVGYMGLAVVAAINLALFRGVTQLLTIPAIVVFLVLLDVALLRLLFWRRPLRPQEYGFIATGIVVAMVTLPFNNEPRILQTVLDFYREVTGDMRVFRFNNAESFIYAERAVLCGVILAVAMSGGALSGWGFRRLKRSPDRTDQTAATGA
jgi:hypothetical protein